MRAMEEILGVPTRTLKEEDTRDTLPEWTSLEFGIEPDGELIAADSVGELIQVLDVQGAFRE
jgi:hypothetical protein